MTNTPNVVPFPPKPELARNSAPAVAAALEALETLDAFMAAFNLDKLAMPEPAFKAASAASNLPPRAFVEQFGVVSELRNRLEAMGWTPPHN